MEDEEIDETFWKKKDMRAPFWASDEFEGKHLGKVRRLLGPPGNVMKFMEVERHKPIARCSTKCSLSALQSGSCSQTAELTRRLQTSNLMISVHVPCHLVTWIFRFLGSIIYRNRHISLVINALYLLSSFTAVAMVPYQRNY